MKTLLIIGVGGVGSFITRTLSEYVITEQPPDLYIHIADGDVVDNNSLLYQDYKAAELFENKAKALSLRYPFITPITEYIDINKHKQILASFNAIISAVDSSVFRKEFFNYVFNTDDNLYWIDVRATSGTVEIYSKHKNNTLQKMLKTLPAIDKTNGSCQAPYDLSRNFIQNGNRIAAEIVIQYILNWYRGNNYLNQDKFIHSF